MRSAGTNSVLVMMVRSLVSAGPRGRRCYRTPILNVDTIRQVGGGGSGGIRTRWAAPLAAAPFRAAEAARDVIFRDTRSAELQLRGSPAPRQSTSGVVKGIPLAELPWTRDESSKLNGSQRRNEEEDT